MLLELMLMLNAVLLLALLIMLILLSRTSRSKLAREDLQKIKEHINSE